jgi:hypothetical protein
VHVSSLEIDAAVGPDPGVDETGSSQRRFDTVELRADHRGIDVDGAPESCTRLAAAISAPSSGVTGSTNDPEAKRSRSDSRSVSAVSSCCCSCCSPLTCRSCSPLMSLRSPAKGGGDVAR